MPHIRVLILAIYKFVGKQVTNEFLTSIIKYAQLSLMEISVTSIPPHSEFAIHE